MLKSLASFLYKTSEIWFDVPHDERGNYVKGLTRMTALSLILGCFVTIVLQITPSLLPAHAGMTASGRTTVPYSTIRFQAILVVGFVPLSLLGAVAGGLLT